MLSSGFFLKKKPLGTMPETPQQLENRRSNCENAVGGGPVQGCITVWGTSATLARGRYGGFGITVSGSTFAKWLIRQERATFRHAGNGYTNSEIALKMFPVQHSGKRSLLNLRFLCGIAKRDYGDKLAIFRCAKSFCHRRSIGLFRAGYPA